MINSSATKSNALIHHRLYQGLSFFISIPHFLVLTSYKIGEKVNPSTPRPEGQGLPFDKSTETCVDGHFSH
jgi:hypothetical protein